MCSNLEVVVRSLIVRVLKLLPSDWDLNPRGWDSNPGKVHGLPIEIIDLVSGHKEAQVPDASLQKEFSERQG